MIASATSSYARELIGGFVFSLPAPGPGAHMSKGQGSSQCQPNSQIEGLAKLLNDQIDTSEIAEILDWSDAKRGVYCQPTKKQITLQLDGDVIDWFKANASGGRGYQTEINRALREHVQRFR